MFVREWHAESGFSAQRVRIWLFEELRSQAVGQSRRCAELYSPRQLALPGSLLDAGLASVALCSLSAGGGATTKPRINLSCFKQQASV